MKKLRSTHFIAWALVLVIPFWSGSCKKSDDNSMTPATSTSIEGNYKVSALKANPKVLGQFEDLLSVAPLVLGTSCLSDVTLQFKSGGIVTTDNPTSCQNSSVPVSSITGVDAASKWVLTGNKLTVTKSDGTKTEYTVLNMANPLQVQWQDSQDFAKTGTKTTYTFTMDLKKM